MDTHVATSLLECAMSAKTQGYSSLAGEILEMLLKNVGITTNIHNAVTVDELDMVRSHGKIEAIKAYRTRTGCCLKDSKDAIENAMARFDVEAKSFLPREY